MPRVSGMDAQGVWLLGGLDFVFSLPPLRNQVMAASQCMRGSKLEFLNSSLNFKFGTHSLSFLQRRKLRPRKVEWLVQTPPLGRSGVGTGPLLTSGSAPQLLHAVLQSPGRLTGGTASMVHLALCLDQWGAPPAYGRQRGERKKGTYSP